METPEPVPDVPNVPDEALSDEEKQKLADAAEALMLEVQACEEDWALDNRLEWLRLHGA